MSGAAPDSTPAAVAGFKAGDTITQLYLLDGPMATLRQLTHDAEPISQARFEQTLRDYRQKADVKKMALFPTAPGNYTIQPGSLKVSIRQEPQGSSAFDEFFSDSFFTHWSTLPTCRAGHPVSFGQ